MAALTDEGLTDQEREELLEALDEALAAAEEEIEEKEMPSAIVELAIYGYQGE